MRDPGLHCANTSPGWATGSRRHGIAGLRDRRPQSPARLARPPADYGLPAQAKTAWYSVARKAQVIRRDRGFAVVFDGGEIMLGASYPIVEWMLKQRVFSLEDAIARQAGVDRAELRADLEKLLDAGVLAETEMR
jgi:hypothetical protein